MKTFFTADTHFGHTNIIKYSKRPFQDANEMDETIIKNWNSVVTDDDIVYHLGDFAYHNVEKASDILSRLKGKQIHFIEGNHDRTARLIRHDFSSYKKFDEIKLDQQCITLCHYAMRVWNKSHHGAFHLYGHSHGSLPDDPNSFSIDVGVDCHNFTPISLEYVASLMAKKQFKPIDHHGKNS